MGEINTARVMGFAGEAMNEVVPEKVELRYGAAIVNNPYRNKALQVARTANNSGNIVVNQSAGIDSLSEFMSSDKVFLIFRRFDKLAVRNLLCLQSELCELERRLEQLDREDRSSQSATQFQNLRSWVKDDNEDRQQVMLQLREKLEIYYRTLHIQSQLPNRPAEEYTASLQNWIEGRNPVVANEAHFLDDKSDLTTLTQRDERTGPLESFIEAHFSKMFTRPHKARRRALSAHQDPNIHYYSLTAIRRVARGILVLTAVIMLTVPIFVLYFVKRMTLRLGLIALFGLLFAVAMSVGTKIRNADMFLALAAYMAVLIVFVGNGVGAG